MQERGIDGPPPELPPGAPRELETMLAEGAHDLPERAELRIEVEDPQDRVLHAPVGISRPPAFRGAQVPDGRWAHRLPPLGLRDLGLPHPTSSHPVVMRREGLGYLEPQRGGEV